MERISDSKRVVEVERCPDQAGGGATKSADALADLYAVDAIHEFPFFMPNGRQRLEGREAVRSSYRDGWRNAPLTIDAVEDVFVLDAADPEVVVGQLRARATLSATGKPVEFSGFLILRVRDGRIVHTRNFVDALGVAKGPRAPAVRGSRRFLTCARLTRRVPLPRSPDSFSTR